jgi:hypothetical protein
MGLDLDKNFDLCIFLNERFKWIETEIKMKKQIRLNQEIKILLKLK